MNPLRKLWCFICQIPILHEVLLIANAYAYCGKKLGLIIRAPLTKYWDRIFYNLFLSTGFVVIGHALNKYFIKIPLKEDLDIAGLNLSIFPNFLGFGIGIYALIFVLDRKFISWLASHEDVDIEPNLINVDLAFPLIIFALISFISGLLTIFHPNSVIHIINLIMFTYGMVMLFELISLIFFTAFKKIDDDIKEKEN